MPRCLTAAALLALASTAGAQTFSFATTLTASNATSSSLFGSDIAVDDVTGRIFIGARFEPGGTGDGRVYVFDGATLGELASFSAAGAPGFGSTLSAGGGFVYTGAPGATPPGVGATGAVYVRTAASLFDLGTLPLTGAALGDGIGLGLAYDAQADRLAVGAPGDDNGAGQNAGAVLVFDSGIQSGPFIPQTPAGDAEFGAALALAGDLVIAGAQFEDDPGNGSQGTNAGSVRVFDPSDPGGTTLLTPSPSDAAGFRFGTSVAADTASGLFAVGAPGDNSNIDTPNPGETNGAVSIYSLATRGFERILYPPTDELFTGFGTAIAMGGGVIAVGAPFEDNGPDNSGAVYVFRADTGALLARLSSPNATINGEFGSSLHMTDDRLFVGTTESVNAGTVHVFDIGIEITPQPTQVIADPDTQVQFSTQVGSISPASFQWTRDGQPLQDGGGVSGTQTPILTLEGVGIEDVAVYNCRVTNASTQADSDFAVLAVRGTCATDTNGDNVTDLADLLAVLAEFGQDCP